MAAKGSDWLMHFQLLCNHCTEFHDTLKKKILKGLIQIVHYQSFVCNSELSSVLQNLPDNDVMADLYMAAVEKLESQGLRRYEVSNFARKGHESQHNLGYWSGMQYIGIGPGAHGRFIPKGLGLTHREWRVQTLEPEFWMREVEKNEHATRKRKPLFQKER
ncbi:hypothetical protein FSP39_012560 [Pinctada imbricata]|uniref:Uncharacterized protein n=1 Tax=Pinctada imbricata TaxID=66713 RepID=A0AA88XY61_PINIB|nr:hypothetical protein FSP39_012560 [Pinctada imbricata]